MHKLLVSLTCLVFFAPAFVSACSSDSNDPPAASAGSAGSAGSPQGGSSTQGGGGQAGGAQGGKPSGAGSGTGGNAGSAQAGSSSGGNAGSGGTNQPEAGAPGSEAGAGGGPGGEVVVECLDAPVIDEVRTEALHFSGQGLELGIVRRVDPDSAGTSGTTPWLPERFALERAAVAECVSDLADLDYVGSHHNFDDQMTATLGAETWIFKQMRVDYDMPTTWTVEGRNGNALAWGPVSLTLVSCTRLDTPGSCADQYQ